MEPAIYSTMKLSVFLKALGQKTKKFVELKLFPTEMSMRVTTRRESSMVWGYFIITFTAATDMKGNLKMVASMVLVKKNI